MSASLCPVISPLSLHDALPISLDDVAERRQPSHLVLASRRVAYGEPVPGRTFLRRRAHEALPARLPVSARRLPTARSEEHTSELQSRLHIVCRLLLEKKKSINF